MSKKEYLDDAEEFDSSEDNYDSQSGGEEENSAKSEMESDTESNTLDIDPDDEKILKDEDQYDPVTDFDEPEDTDEDLADAKKEDEDEEENAEIGTGKKQVDSKECYLKNKDFVPADEDDSTTYGKLEYRKILNENRESDPIMTFYEMVRIIGTRAQQFNFGAEPLVKGLEGLHPAKMAYLELVAKMTPFIIRRHLPGKLYEEWRVDELEIVHVITDEFFIPEKFDWDQLMELEKKGMDALKKGTDALKKKS
jgi:DNA-directed RNA polymerase subunit K/omega